MRLPAARTTAGTPYQPNRQHMGKGAMRYCSCCQEHRAIGPGWAKYGIGMACPSCRANMSQAPILPTAATGSTPATTASPQPLLEWQQPGYRFSIDWPPGFTPQMDTREDGRRPTRRRMAEAFQALDQRSETIVGGGK